MEKKFSCNKYVVKDSQGNTMRVFATYQQASTYKFACGNYQWTIKKIR